MRLPLILVVLAWVPLASCEIIFTESESTYMECLEREGLIYQLSRTIQERQLAQQEAMECWIIYWSR